MDERSVKTVSIDLTDDQAKMVRETLGVDCGSLRVNPTDMVRLKERRTAVGTAERTKLVFTPEQRDTMRERLGDSIDSLSLSEDDVIIVYGVPEPPDPDIGAA
jgi:hypothetical protein